MITSSEASRQAADPLLNPKSNQHLVKQVLLQRQLEFIQFLPLFLEPEGMFPPEVVIINSTAVRVIWTSPSNPNGVVTEYSVYVNNKKYRTGMNTAGSFLVGDLSPFTIYDIQVRKNIFYALCNLKWEYIAHICGCMNINAYLYFGMHKWLCANVCTSVCECARERGRMSHAASLKFQGQILCVSY